MFTTKGHLSLVSEYALAFTHAYGWSAAATVKSHFSNVLHLSNTSTGLGANNLYDGYYGNIDCETNPVGMNGARECLNKNDWVMVFGTDFTINSDAAHLAANPVYPNLYQVKKIFRARKTFDNDPSNPNSEKLRNQIVLDYSNNAEFVWAGGRTGVTDSSAQVYKFFPPTNNADGGYRYVGACSNRGICNTGTGMCECFKGYTSDNCGVINALAQ